MCVSLTDDPHLSRLAGRVVCMCIPDWRPLSVRSSRQGCMYVCIPDRRPPSVRSSRQNFMCVCIPHRRPPSVRSSKQGCMYVCIPDRRPPSVRSSRQSTHTCIMAYICVTSLVINLGKVLIFLFPFQDYEYPTTKKKRSATFIKEKRKLYHQKKKELWKDLALDALTKQ